jgi:predicted alpha/beta-hydrolase family hydrolase
LRLESQAVPPEIQTISIEGVGRVSAIFMRPAKARWLLALAHGAGAGMTHPFLASLAEELGKVEVATLRYQFPYMEEMRKLPDPPAVLQATVVAAVVAASKLGKGLQFLAGGKSMGGRMTSQAAAAHTLAEVRGLVFYGFPLHPPKTPGTKRAEHLSRVSIPMLFLQGTRDTLADLSLLRPICAELGTRATLRVLDTADHGFHFLKRSGKTDTDGLRELAETTASWAAKL